MAGERYATQYDLFNDKFKLNLDIKGEFEVHSRFGVLDDFTFDSTPQKKIQNAYLKTLNNALKVYLEEKTKIQYGKAYDMSDVSIVEFVNEFDKVMDAICTDAAPEGEPYQYPRFAGLSESAMAVSAWKNVKHFNQPLGGIWGDQIRKGTLTLDDLQNFTSKSTNSLDSMVRQSKKYNDVAKNDLATVVMARNAMAEAINKRSWTSWLNPLNWGPNRRENNLLKELEGKLATYKQAGFPVDNVVPEEYTKNMLGKALGELQRAYATKNQATKNNNTSVKSDKNSAKNQDIPGPVPNKETAEALYNDKNNVKAKFSELVADYASNEIYKDIGTTMAYNVVSRFADKCWDEFNAAKNEEQKQTVLAEHSKNMFEKIYTHVVQDLNYSKTVPEKLAMAQKLTDFAMNTYSPVASNSRYAKYGDNYFIQNVDPATASSHLYSAGTPDEIEQSLAQARYELGKGKMSLPLDKEFKENPSKASEKTQNINVPTKNMHIDM